jgi:hypothetical protein
LQIDADLAKQLAELAILPSRNNGTLLSYV